MRKIFRKLHLWLSIPFGIFIMLTCLSGASLVFETEITEWIHPERYYVNRVEKQAIRLDDLLDRVASTLPDSVSVTSVTIASDKQRTYQVNLSKPRRSSLYVDQYTGQITGKNEREPFFDFMFRLHRWLLGSGTSVGKLIVGISTLALIVILVTGLVIWWPRNRKAVKSRFSISLHKGWGKFWHDLHVAGGIYALLFLLAMALTGLNWSFGWYRSGFYKIFGVEAKERSMHGGDASNAGGHPHRGERPEHGKPIRRSAFANWQKVYEQLAQENPNFRQITVSKASANVSNHAFGNQRGSDNYHFNPRTGEITECTLYKDADASDKLFGWIYSVHVGIWGGMLTRILAFIAALLGATLPLTGYYLWLNKGKRKKKEERDC